jgi:hypothetical protein
MKIYTTIVSGFIVLLTSASTLRAQAARDRTIPGKDVRTQIDRVFAQPQTGLDAGPSNVWIPVDGRGQIHMATSEDIKCRVCGRVIVKLKKNPRKPFSSEPEGASGRVDLETTTPLERLIDDSYFADPLRAASKLAPNRIVFEARSNDKNCPGNGFVEFNVEAKAPPGKSWAEFLAATKDASGNQIANLPDILSVEHSDLSVRFYQHPKGTNETGSVASIPMITELQNVTFRPVGMVYSFESPKEDGKTETKEFVIYSLDGSKFLGAIQMAKPPKPKCPVCGGERSREEPENKPNAEPRRDAKN